jgi:hypothetical protein
MVYALDINNRVDRPLKRMTKRIEINFLKIRKKITSNIRKSISL